MAGPHTAGTTLARRNAVNALLEHALCYPSSFNLQHCRFVLVDDGATLAGVANAFGTTGHGAGERAPDLLLVLAGDTGAWQRCADYSAHLPQELQAMLGEKAHHVYAGNERVQRDEAFRSIGLAAANLIRLADAEGLALRPLACVDPAALAQAIRLPPAHVVGYCFAIDPQPAAAPSYPPARTELMYTNHYPGASA